MCDMPCECRKPYLLQEQALAKRPFTLRKLTMPVPGPKITGLNSRRDIAARFSRQNLPASAKHWVFVLYLFSKVDRLTSERYDMTSGESGSQ